MKITIEVDTTDVKQLRTAQGIIEAQLRLLAVSEAPDDQPVIATIEAMWPEVKARRLLSFAAMGWEPEQEFTLEDLVPNMGLNLASVKAVHRNLARALKARGVDLSLVMPSRWDGQRQHYHLPTAVHTLVRSLDLRPSFS